MKAKLDFLFLALALLAFPVKAEDRIGKIFEVGKTQTVPLFVQKTHREEKSPGNWTQDSTIVDGDGKLVMTEKAVVVDGHLVSQFVEQMQLNESYELQIKDGQATFFTYDFKDGKQGAKKEESSEKATDHFLTGPIADSFVKAHSADLLAGKSVAVDFAVFEVGKTVGFTLKSKGKKTVNGKEVLEIRMKPSSFFLSIFVDPIDMDFDAQDYKLVHFKGRTPVRKKVGDHWQAMDAEIQYSTN